MKSSKKTASTHHVSSTPNDQENTPMKATKKSAAHVPASSTPNDQENTPMKITSPVTATSTLPASIAATGTVDAVPPGVAPSPPTDFVASNPGRGPRPQRTQVNLALKVASELQKSADYTTVFGTAAPSPVIVANALTLARAWSDKLRNAEAWYEYVKEEETLAWREALALAAPLRIPLEMNLARDASVAQDLPSTVAFLMAGTERANRGVATKKEKKKAEAKKAATATPAAVPATPAPATAPLTDPVKAAAVKLLNLN